jgi:DNA polymerase III subunit gamma/tau
MALDETAYRVLARKYRPRTFAELIGQDVMVQTLANAIAAKRLAHAFVLTGVRGVGKTTTARLLASALNCLEVKPGEEMAQSPCGKCANCVAIAESRHPDVIEMDAASRTGVEDVREIIENVRYAPQSARFKVYIVDEVHMLSKSAFNALLKTLEEPPPHVKFIFATTEIRKLPVTVLSRCQRFDLRRVETARLAAHLQDVIAKEKAKADEEAVGLIARAAEGSVRDALSLLDQAIAHGGDKVTAGSVRAMLGLADRIGILKLFRALMAGEIKAALALLAEQYKQGAEPSAVVRDLLEATHGIARIKVSGEAGTDALVSEGERSEAAALAEKLSLADLTRAWQILLKGLRESETAPSPIAAAEMVAIRLAHAATLPDPAKLVKALAEARGGNGESRTEGPSGDHGSRLDLRGESRPGPSAEGPRAERRAESNVVALTAAEAKDFLSPMPQTFPELVALFERRHEGVIGKYLYDDVSLVAFKPGALTFHALRNLPAQLPSRMRELLKAWTGETWQVTLAKAPGQPSLKEAEEARERAHDEAARANPLVQKALATFPGAVIAAVRPLAGEGDEEP